MDDKECSRCHELKPITVFRWKRKKFNERISMCDICDPIYRAERYQRRKDHVLALGRACSERRREKIAREGVPDGDRRCIECLKTKPADDFRWINIALGYRAPRCKPCDAIFRSYTYPDRKADIIASNKRQYEKLRLLLDSLKTDPCCDCGKNFPVEAMDFDHIDPTTKIDKISAMIYKGSEPLLLAEVAKCELVCANCHRIRTRKRLKENKNGQRESRAS